MGIQGPAIFQVMQRFFFLQSAEALPALPHPGEAEHSTPIYVTRWNPGTVELYGGAGELWVGQGNCGSWDCAGKLWCVTGELRQEARAL